MKITAQDMVRFGVIDSIVPSRPAARTAIRTRPSPRPARPSPMLLPNCAGSTADAVRKQRREKFLTMGRQ